MQNLINLDNCHSDYFRGYHKTVFIAFYDKHTTILDILDQVELDANNYCDFQGFKYSDFKKAMLLSRHDNRDVLQNAYMPNCDFSFSENDSDYIGDENIEFSPIAYFSIESDTE